MKRFFWIAVSLIIVLVSLNRSDISHDLTPKQAVNYDLIALCLMSFKHVD